MAQEQDMQSDVKIQASDGQREKWPSVKFPPSFVHPYTHEAKNGQSYDMLMVNIPANTKINGVDVGGYSFSAFASKFSKEDQLNGRDVKVSFRPGQKVELFKGEGDQRESLTLDDPWALCRGVKAGRDAWAAQKAQEREAAAPEAAETASSIEDPWQGQDPADPMNMTAPEASTGMTM